MMKIRDRLFHAYARTRRPMTLGVRGIVENAAGEICLVRHTYTPGWHFPGGGVERAETTLTSLSRELEEEAGIALKGPAHLFGIYSNHVVFPNDHVLVFRVHADNWSPVAATSKGEIAEIVWVSPSSPPGGATPGTLQRIAEVYSDAAIIPDWSPTKR